MTSVIDIMDTYVHTQPPGNLVLTIELVESGVSGVTIQLETTHHADH